MGGTMPADVLERVCSEIEDRLAVLSDAVSEAQELEIALAALEEVPVASRPAADAGQGHHRHKAPSRLHRRKGRRRKRARAGANDQAVLGSLQGQTEPLDIKAVAGMTGLSQQTAAYTLKKLAGKGLLTQSSVARGRGRPKLVFALASNGQATQAGAATDEAASPQMSKTRTSAATKRKARTKARRRSKAPASSRAD
jgi:DNA-binding PadR family transcriptional regulator